MNKTLVYEKEIIIPTYEIKEYDKNPMFLEKRVYQGSSGKVYPHPVCEGVEDEKRDHVYKAVFLENDYIQVMVLPELGGRIQRLLDKTNNYDAVYYNEVVKPALVGLAGPWISGGIEFNWPQHHRPSTFDRVDYSYVENEDGSATVFVGETEKMFHTKTTTAFTVYKDRSYLEIKGTFYNPTDSVKTFLWWANPAVSVNDDTQSIFPKDVTAVFDHGKRDVSKFPISDSVYYKVNYAPGTDISRYKNVPVPTSYMADHSDYDFVGNYDYGKKAGLLHVANHHISPGKKQWTWGNGDFGRAWDRNLTDENGPYIELMTGTFTDNQPDFTFLKPYEEKTFTEYFFPYREVGEINNANSDFVVGIKLEEKTAKVKVYATKKDSRGFLNIYSGRKLLCEESIAASPDMPYELSFEYKGREEDLGFKLTYEDGKVLEYEYKERKEELPLPASEIKAPELIETNEKLFLAATHLEQYRHATFSPEDYYREGLKRDRSDIRINNGYGKYLYNKGLYLEALSYFEEAIKSSEWKNPNPYDCECYYNSGLCYMKLGQKEKAFDRFYKATWDQAQMGRAFYKLACIEATRDLNEALKLVDKSLVNGLHNMKARTLKTAILRRLGLTEEALSFATDTKKIDPLDMGACFEACFINGSLDEYIKIFGRDNHNFIELANYYLEADFKKEATALLNACPNKNDPMLHYYLYSVTEDENELNLAEKADSLYCFPNRLEDMDVLWKAYFKGAAYAAYYLGVLLYDKGRFKDSTKLWEDVKDKITLPTVHRNLALSYFNKLGRKEDALKEMETAYAMDESDVRILYELDALYKVLHKSDEERMAFLEAHRELLDKRDDLFTEYILLTNNLGKYEEALSLIENHIFHPWEGGEGKISKEYKRALIGLSMTSDNKKELLEKALVYPHNLGEGKLIGNLDNDLYFLLGEAEEDTAKKNEYYRLASRGDFELKSAMYYNDQPPEMMYYATMALLRLGQKELAKERFEEMASYYDKHYEDEVKIDYFAVSLPDFLIFEGDLKEKNIEHCRLISSLGREGLANIGE